MARVSSGMVRSLSRGSVRITVMKGPLGRGKPDCSRSLQRLGVRRNGNGKTGCLACGSGLVVGFVRPGAGEAVATSRRALDTSLAHKRVQCRGDRRVAYACAFSDLGLHEWGSGLREHLHDPLFGAFRLRRGLVGSCPPEPQGRPIAVIGKLDPDIVEAGGGAMLDSHDDLPVASAQVEIAVAPGMQLAAAAQTDPGIEDEEPRADALDGFQQSLTVFGVVETQRGHVEGLEVGAGGTGDALDAVADH